MIEEFVAAVKSFRDLALAGLVWMFSIWVALPTQLGYGQTHGDVASALVPIAEVLQNVGAVIGLLITATLLGAVSVQVFRAPALWVANLTMLAVKITEAIVLATFGLISRSPRVKRYAHRESMAVDPARRIARRHHEELLALVGNNKHAAAKLEQRVYDEIERRLQRELIDPQKSNSVIVELNGQASFRLCLVFPLIALASALVYTFGSRWFAITFVFPFVVAFQAVDFRIQRDEELEALIWPEIDLTRLANG